MCPGPPICCYRELLRALQVGPLPRSGTVEGAKLLGESVPVERSVAVGEPRKSLDSVIRLGELDGFAGFSGRVGRFWSCWSLE